MSRTLDRVMPWVITAGVVAGVLLIKRRPIKRRVQLLTYAARGRPIVANVKLNGPLEIAPGTHNLLLSNVHVDAKGAKHGVYVSGLRDSGVPYGGRVHPETGSYYGPDPLRPWL